jgi:hypothetical protein
MIRRPLCVGVGGQGRVPGQKREGGLRRGIGRNGETLAMRGAMRWSSAGLRVGECWREGHATRSGDEWCCMYREGREREY